MLVFRFSGFTCDPSGGATLEDDFDSTGEAVLYASIDRRSGDAAAINQQSRPLLSLGVALFVTILYAPAHWVRD